MDSLRREIEQYIGRTVPSSRFCQMLRALPYNHRQVLRLRYAMEMAPEDIAQVLWNEDTYDYGVSPNAAAARIYRARQSLLRRL